MTLEEFPSQGMVLQYDEHDWRAMFHTTGTCLYALPEARISLARSQRTPTRWAYRSPAYGSPRGDEYEGQVYPASA